MERSSTYRDMMITAIKAGLMAVYIHELLENSLSTIAWIVLDDEILERKLANITISWIGILNLVEEIPEN